MTEDVVQKMLDHRNSDLDERIKLALDLVEDFVNNHAHGVDDSTIARLREHYLSQRPKAKLYIDFGDFRLVRFDVQTAFLNGGFGKAYKLSSSDLERS